MKYQMESLNQANLQSPLCLEVQNKKLGKMHEPVRKVHAAVPNECDEEEHPPLCKYLPSLLQGKFPLRHVPVTNIRKTFFSLKLKFKSLLGKKKGGPEMKHRVLIQAKS